MKNRASVALFAGMILVASPVDATSARTIHPELLGFQKVVLNFSPQTVPGLDTDALEEEIRKRLDSSGLEITEAADTVLFVQIKYQRLPACPDFLLIQTHVAISEDAQVRRANASESVYVDTWKVDEDFVEPISEAADVASTSTLGLIDYLLGAREYTASVMTKQK